VLDAIGLATDAPMAYSFSNLGFFSTHYRLYKLAWWYFIVFKKSIAKNYASAKLATLGVKGWRPVHFIIRYVGLYCIRFLLCCSKYWVGIAFFPEIQIRFSFT
jgi:hypothetical protein